MGKLLQIWLRPSARTPVRAVPRAEAVAGQGLEGDHAGGGKRQVTLIAREAWADALRELGGAPLDASARRANLLVEGLELGAAIGRRLRVGPIELQVEGETRPCGLMDDARPGLRDALAPACRGGVYARILAGGPLQVGDEVALLDAEVPREATAR
jgi:MOSC domain-containing protein YiiM